MSLPDLAGAVRTAGVHLDVINFDACLMAMYEVAYEFLGLTDYMVFSEEVEPGDGDPYDTILFGPQEPARHDRAGTGRNHCGKIPCLLQRSGHPGGKSDQVRSGYVGPAGRAFGHAEICGCDCRGLRHRVRGDRPDPGQRSGV